MSEPFIGEIRMFAGTYAPEFWAFCDGQILQISDNTALFSLLGDMYGGDGRSTFALPNMKSRVPMGSGHGAGLAYRRQGDLGGSTQEQLTIAEIPTHTHSFEANSLTANDTSPEEKVLGVAPGGSRGPKVYAPSNGENTPLSPVALAKSGGSYPHENMQPYLVVNFIIALQGIYPSRS